MAAPGSSAKVSAQSARGVVDGGPTAAADWLVTSVPRVLGELEHGGLHNPEHAEGVRRELLGRASDLLA